MTIVAGSQAPGNVFNAIISRLDEVAHLDISTHLLVAGGVMLIAALVLVAIARHYGSPPDAKGKEMAVFPDSPSGGSTRRLQNKAKRRSRVGVDETGAGLSGYNALSYVP